MIIKYVNNFNETIYLNRYPYKMLISDILDYDFETIISNNHIAGFESNIVRERTVSVDAHRTKDKSASMLINELTDIFNKDVLSGVPGKLYIDDWYLPCYFKGRMLDRWDTGVIISSDYKIVFDKETWIKELKKQFLPQSVAESAEGLDFPFDFPFDFAPPTVGQAVWNVEHYTSSHFLMTIHGPCVDPVVRINGYPYQIHTVLEKGDYLTIDSRANEVYKHLANGSKESLYNSRDFAHSVFEKIPSGLLQITWPGTFGYDITLFLERSEPRW